MDFRHRITVLLALLLGGMVVILLVADAVRGDWEFVFIEACTLLVIPVLLALLRAGRQELAAHLLMGVLWAGVTSSLSVGAGLWSVTMGHLMLVVVISGLLLDAFGLALWSIATLMTLGLLAVLHVTGFTEVAPSYSGSIAARAMEQGLSVVIASVSMFLVQRMQQRANAALSAEVVERRRAEEVALAAVSARERFLATVSHELRTPISGILGVSALLEKTELTDEQSELVGMITSSGDVLLALVKDILDYSRMNADIIELERVPICLSPFLDGASRALALVGRQKGLSVEVRCSPLLPDWILADETRLRQIVINLLGNAVKFTDSGHVYVIAQPLGAFWTLRIEDTGMGIPEDALETLFDPFTQADISTTRKFGGTGLGLSIVHRIVERMDGAITVSSAVGEGTIFEVRLPLAVAQAPPAEDVAVEKGPAGLRVLLVDDHPLNRLIAARTLTQAGHRVREAVNGFEAVAAAEKGGWDVILMDCQMPGMDGLQATRAIRKLPGRRGEVCIIGLSASVAPSEQEAGLQAGMDRYLTKPFRPEALFEALAELCITPV